ncbi:MAG: TolC family outer membrane protein [Hyphomicrobiaceae bacterium]|nr:TolC family outer membrane protein [Hyphomicrobiaceae bacterium]
MSLAAIAVLATGCTHSSTQNLVTGSICSRNAQGVCAGEDSVISTNGEPVEVQPLPPAEAQAMPAAPNGLAEAATAEPADLAPAPGETAAAGAPAVATGEAPGPQAPFTLAAGPSASLEELGLRAASDPLSLTPPDRPAAAEVADTEGAEEELAAAEAAVEEGAEETPALTQPTPEEIAAVRPSVSGAQGEGERMTLAYVVNRAATMHPEIIMAMARLEEARAGAEATRSALLPQVDLSLAAGHNTTGSFAGEPFMPTSEGSIGAGRVDGTVSVRQILFDFDATRQLVRSDIATADAAHFRLMDKTEDIVLQTAVAYLNILQQRQLIALVDQNIQAHERFLTIVQANEEDGNGTLADVNRVSARLVEVRALRTDLSTQLEAAVDQFRRLARTAPGRLEPPESVMAAVPTSLEDALALALQRNPRLMALEYAVRASQYNLAAIRAGDRPRIDLEVEGAAQNYIGQNRRTDIDVRGMVVFSYRLFDGGRTASETEQAEARIRQSRARYTNERDAVEAELEDAYRSITAARVKLDDLREGVRASRQVRELYTEQFRAGERTIFELLDAQNSLFSAERELITNQFSELQAAYSALRGIGRLTATIVGVPRERS